jgi:hypothetical protein
MNVATTTPKPTATELTDMLPPPYTPPAHGFLDEDDEEEEESAPRTNISIHAPTSIHGSNNIVTMPMLDTTRLAGIIMTAINQKITAVGSQQNHFNIHINCGINIVGERNIVGNLPMRKYPMPGVPSTSTMAEVTPTPTVPNQATVSPASLGKRKASEVCEDYQVNS